VRQARNDLARIAGMQPDVLDLLLDDLADELCRAVDERLAADEAPIGMCPRLRRKMLAAAEADLEGELLRLRKNRREIERARGRDTERRKPGVEERLLTRTQRLADAAAIEPLAPHIRVVGDQWKWRFSPGTRSVFSHENPPSASGARPKWP